MLTHVLQTLKQLYKRLVPELPERNCSVDCVLMPLHTDIYPNLRFSRLSSNSLPTSNLVSHQILRRSMSHNAVCNYCMFSGTLGLLLPRQGNYSLVHRNNLKLSISCPFRSIFVAAAPTSFWQILRERERKESVTFTIKKICSTLSAFP